MVFNPESAILKKNFFDEVYRDNPVERFVNVFQHDSYIKQFVQWVYDADQDPFFAFNPARSHQPASVWDRLMASAQPLASIANDFLEYGQSYGNEAEYHKDWLQIVRALQNILRSVLNLLAVIDALATLVESVTNMILHVRAPNLDTISITASNLVYATVDAASSLLRGVSQLLTLPLLLFVKYPARLWHTSKNWQPVENNPYVNALARKALNLLEWQKNTGIDQSTTIYECADHLWKMITYLENNKSETNVKHTEKQVFLTDTQGFFKRYAGNVSIDSLSESKAKEVIVTITG